MYGELMSKANCVATGSPTTNPYTCHAGGLDAKLTKKGVQRGVSVAICGTVTALGYAGAAAGAGESVGGSIPLASAIVGFFGCGWSFWSSFS